MQLRRDGAKRSLRTGAAELSEARAILSGSVHSHATPDRRVVVTAAPELTAKLSSITAETLVVWGRDDRLALPARRIIGANDSTCTIALD
jgi:hypothetical protein